MTSSFEIKSDRKGLDRTSLRKIFGLLDSQLKELENGRDLRGQRILNVEQYRNEVRAAIRRIGFGIYGICDTCAEDIPAELLEREPIARQCEQCQNDFENAIKLRAASNSSDVLPFPVNPL